MFADVNELRILISVTCTYTNIWAWSDYRFHIAYHRHMWCVCAIIMKKFFYSSSQNVIKSILLTSICEYFWKYKMNSIEATRRENFHEFLIMTLNKPDIVILIHALASIITSWSGQRYFLFFFNISPATYRYLTFSLQILYYFLFILSFHCFQHQFISHFCSFFLFDFLIFCSSFRRTLNFFCLYWILNFYYLICVRVFILSWD